jgi:hypothetical protein
LTLPTIALFEWRARHPARRLVSLAGGLAPALLLCAVFFLPYLKASSELGSARSVPDSLAPARYVAVLPGSWLYHTVLPPGSPNANAAHFLGFAALALALVGLARGRFRDGLPLGKGLFASLAVIGFLLSLGPRLLVAGRALAPAPYQWVYDWVPGFRNVRYPERFALFVVLGLCPLVAAGLARLGARSTLLPAFASVVLFLEHLAVPLPLKPLPSGAQIPEVYRWLAAQDDIHVLAEVPAGKYWAPRAHARQMYFSTVHWKRTLQGLTGYLPPAYEHAQWRLQRFPEAESVAFLEDLGVDAVVVHRGMRAACADGGPLPVAMSFADGTCVVRLSPTGRFLRPPPPEHEALIEVERTGWRAAASRPGAEAALDGDARTVWTARPWQVKGDAFSVRFAAPVAVARVGLFLPRPFEFPMRLALIGERPDGGSIRLAFDERAAYDRLFLSQLHTPRDARLTIDLPEVVLARLTLRIRETDPFQMPWTMSEIRVFTRAPKPAAAGPQPRDPS